jgi:polysaccharide export outer membrane protein
MHHVPRIASQARQRHLSWLALLCCLLAGCAGTYIDKPTQEVPPAVLQLSLRFQKEYLLAAGDQLEVVVWRVPEASRVVAVRPDGHISLPLLQDVPAAGLTPRELSQRIAEGLATRLVNPQVNVLMQNVRQPMVYVLGDVGAPAAYPLRNAGTALQALAAAGGVRRSGAEHEVSVVRLSAEGYLQALPVSTSSDGQLAPYLTLAAMPLQSDDIVFVPEGRRSQVMRFMDDFVLKPLQTALTYRLIANN